MYEKLLFTFFLTVHMSWCTVYVYHVHQALVFKKKRKTLKRNKREREQGGSKDHQSGPIQPLFYFYFF